jgi:hypothetical protein
MRITKIDMPKTAGGSDGLESIKMDKLGQLFKKNYGGHYNSLALAFYDELRQLLGILALNSSIINRQLWPPPSHKIFLDIILISKYVYSKSTGARI